MVYSLDEKQLDFKTFEKAMYDFVCELGRIFTRDILERIDEGLMKERNKARYRNKGKKATVIKTLYGEVTYERRVYSYVDEDGLTKHIFLLDKAMGGDRIGLISAGLAEQIVNAAAEMPYRKAASVIGNTTGQTISHEGVRRLVAAIGDRISEEEDAAVAAMRQGHTGTREIPVLFEEMDGVWLRMQGKDHRKRHGCEIKVGATYEGWSEEGERQKRSELVNKRVLVGMESGSAFREKFEARIEQQYNPDEIGQRILNGDGGNWIVDEYDPETISQLDRFHIFQEILRDIHEKEAVREIRKLFEKGKIPEMLTYIRNYADSHESTDPEDHNSRDAERLYKYLKDNEDKLLPYQSRGIEIPQAPVGIVYKGMGVEENQNCTVITLRMKNRRMRWSMKGANCLGKVLAARTNGELIETIERYQNQLIPGGSEGVQEVLSAGSVPKKEGKGSRYIEVLQAHMPLLDAKMNVSQRAFVHHFCG